LHAITKIVSFWSTEVRTSFNLAIDVADMQRRTTASQISLGILVTLKNCEIDNIGRNIVLHHNTSTTTAATARGTQQH
jgi:hypothetical protein